MLAKSDDPEEVLRQLIPRRAVVLKRPPDWWSGRAPDGGFLLGIDGAFVILVSPTGIQNGVASARPWTATSFISLILSPADIAQITGEELAAHIVLPSRVLAPWQPQPDSDESEDSERSLRGARVGASEREMRAHDTPRSAAELNVEPPTATPGAAEPIGRRFGVRPGGINAPTSTGLHYPDLLLITSAGHVPIELELSCPSAERLGAIMCGYQPSRTFAACST